MATEDGKVIYKVVIDDSEVEPKVEKAGKKAKRAVKKSADESADFVKESSRKSEKSVEDAGEVVTKKARKAGNQVKDATKEVGKNVEDTAKETGKGVEDAAKAAGKGVEDTTKETGEKVKESTRKTGEDIGESGHKHASVFHDVMVGAARRIGSAFVELAGKAVNAVGDIAKAGIEFNAKMETYQTAFTTLLGSAEEAERVMNQIREDAARTPFDVDSLTQANQMLVSAGISADDARSDVLNLANAIAATGGGSAELSRMAANMQQIQNTGKATAMDIRQFANAGINIYGLLADSMGVTTEQAAEMDVTYEQLTAAFEKAASAGGKYEGALEKQSQTFTGRISTLKDNATQLAGALTEDLFTTLSDTALPMVMDWVATLLEAAQTGGIEGAMEAAQGILGGLLDTFISSLPEMVDTGLTILESLLSGIGNNIPNVVQTVITVLQALLNGLYNHLPAIMQAGVDILVGLVTGLLQMIPWLITQIPEIIYAILNIFLSTDWGSIGVAIVDGIWAGIVSLWDWLVSSVENALTNLWNSAKNALGIHSPSKKFAFIGEMSVEGTMEGFEDSEAEMTRVVRDIYSGVSDTAADALRPVDVGYNGYSRQDIEREVSFRLQATGTTGGMTIVVPLSLDGREIARATAWSMGEQLAWEEL